MNVQHRLSERFDYAKLASAPIGLLVVFALMRSEAAASGPSLSTLAIDLMGLAMVALVGWLGGEFVIARGHYAERRRARRARPRHRLAHKAV